MCLDYAGKVLVAAAAVAAIVVGSRVDDKSHGHTQRPLENRCFVSTIVCFTAVRTIALYARFRVMTITIRTIPRVRC